jgi:7-cyano-7-deazaguanine synthase in queuosine biosynthesis
MNTITVCGVDIDIADGPCGISMSGGADSSLLLYILMKNHPGPIHVFTCVSQFKLRGNHAVSQAVVKCCVELTGNQNVIHHTWFVEKQSNENLFDTQRHYRNLGLFDSMYSAVTANPPADIANSFRHLNTEQAARDPNVTRPIWLDNICRPFTNIDKRVISNMYAELALRDRLFPITRSCESVEQSVGHCGICWWCEERQWGFGRLT